MLQSCRIKMLRYFYLLSLLICINISFCYEYTSDNESSNSPKSRKIRNATNRQYRKRNVDQRRLRKRHDYDMAYDKDPVAQIDVANFIKSVEDESFGESDPYEFQYNNMKHGKNYNDYGNLNEINSEEKAYNNEDYSDINAESLHENHLNLNLDATSTENKAGKAMLGFDNTLRNNLDDGSFSKSNVHNQQKKCALKNIKLPFFSHNKSATTRGKKNKKRKLYGFTKLRKGKVSKENSDKRPDKNNIHVNQDPYKYYKIDKRSYVERLCPACKRKFIVNEKLDVKYKRNNIFRNTYNTRQINDDKSYSENANKNTNKVDIDYNNFTSQKEINFKESWRDRRRKREDDNRNIERQKELDDLERRVESVSVIHPSYNKADSKT